MEWLEYYRQDLNAESPLVIHLAQIALEMRRSYAKNPNRFKLEQFILKYQHKRSVPEPKTDDEKSAHIARSKAAWLGMVFASVRPKGKKRHGHKNS